MTQSVPLVLVAEDDPSVTKLMDLILRKEGYQVVSAASGEEAVEMAITHSPDVVLLDLGLPSKNGLAVCHDLRADSRTEDTPIVVVTGNSTKESVTSSLEQGATDYVTKPFIPEELVARVGAAFRAKCRLDALKVRNEFLSEMAFVDELTGLYNRRRMLERLGEEFNRARRYNYPLGCLFIDVDRFKDINDAHGHSVGDEVLREVGTLVRGCVRIYDVACRYGGEEVVVILPQATLDQSLIVAERIRGTIEAMTASLGKVPVTVSIGASAYPDSASTVDMLLEQADHAMYEAKQAGRNRVVPIAVSSGGGTPAS